MKSSGSLEKGHSLRFIEVRHRYLGRQALKLFKPWALPRQKSKIFLLSRALRQQRNCRFTVVDGKQNGNPY